MTIKMVFKVIIKMTNHIIIGLIIYLEKIHDFSYFLNTTYFLNYLF